MGSCIDSSYLGKVLKSSRKKCRSFPCKKVIVVVAAVVIFALFFWMAEESFQEKWTRALAASREKSTSMHEDVVKIRSVMIFNLGLTEEGACIAGRGELSFGSIAQTFWWAITTITVVGSAWACLFCTGMGALCEREDTMFWETVTGH